MTVKVLDESKQVKEMLSLEKYKGANSRHICPSCKSKNEFTRFIDDGGNYISEDVGICNRASKCGYSYTAKQFFADNPERKIGLRFGKGKNIGRSTYALENKNVSQAEYTATTPDFLPLRHLIGTLGNYEENRLVQFLLATFPNLIEEIQEAVKRYFIGTTKLGKTVFWQVDHKKRIRTGKIIDYDSTTGKRRKDVKPNWIHNELKKLGQIEEDFNLMQCFFGQHLLPENSDKIIAVVESEKSAILGSIFFPEWLWLSIGSKQGLTVERLLRLGTRQVMLFPDADGFDQWQAVASDANRQGLDVRVSTLIETLATDEQKKDGYDIADYLIEQARVARVEPVLQPIVEQVKQSEARVEQSEARVEPTIIDFANPCTLDQATVDALCNRF